MDYWLAPPSIQKNKNVLMLDLEQVVFSSAPSLMRADFWKEEDREFYDEYCQLRTHAKTFVQRIEKLFDKVYFNTGVPEDQAHYLFQTYFDTDFEYYASGSSLKSIGYEDAPADWQLFHIEDSIFTFEKEIAHMKQHGIHIFDVKPYNTHIHSDDELLKVLEVFENIL